MGILTSRSRWWIAPLVLAACLVSLPFALRSVGRWLAAQDSLERADTIVVFGGHLPFRAMEAGAIYQKGMAAEVWVTRPAVSAEDRALEKLDIGFIAEPEYSVRALQRLGAPAPAIHVISGNIVNTEDEVRETVQALRASGKKSAILVTSKYHAQRVRTIWRALAGSEFKATVRFTPDDPFDPDRWWRNSRDALAVTREMGGILNAWAGFPLKAARN